MVVVVAEAAVGVQAEAMVEEQVPFSPEVPQGHRLALHLVAGLVLQFHKVKFSVAERREVGLGAIYMETEYMEVGILALQELVLLDTGFRITTGLSFSAA